uniref:Uncharacterized protein n=1 Tax=Salvator merianae TaxID=96440 RepID=A0A8D0E8G7_SALMN
ITWRCFCDACPDGKTCRVDEGSELVLHILFQEGHVIFYLTSIGLQLLPHLHHLLHQKVVEVLPIGPHGLAELFNLLVNLLIQAFNVGCHRFPETSRVFLQLLSQLLGQRAQLQPQILSSLEELGPKLLSILFHLERESLYLVHLGLELISVG